MDSLMHVGGTVAIITVLFSPAYIVRIFDNLWEKRPLLDDPYWIVPYPKATTIIPSVNEPTALETDETRLARLREIQGRATSPWAKRHWVLQEQLLRREMKWRTLAADTQGTCLQNGARS